MGFFQLSILGLVNMAFEVDSIKGDTVAMGGEKFFWELVTKELGELVAISLRVHVGVGELRGEGHALLENWSLRLLRVGTIESIKEEGTGLS